MLCIVEGPDGAGKSTLVSKIAAELSCLPGLDVEIFHRGPPTRHPLDEYETPLIDYRPRTGRNVVCDRWHVGEWVYPQVLKRKTQADTATWRHLEMFLAARGAVVVYILPSITELKRRVGEDDWLIENDDLDEIRMWYLNAIDMTVNNGNMLLDPNNRIEAWQVIQNATWLENEAARVVHRGSYVGLPRPNVLLVGERREFEEPYPPAFGPYPATCGNWMLKALDVRHAAYGLANAYEENLEELWVSLGQPRVVALGRRADQELTKAGLRHGVVPHPQYVRRFHYREDGWYDALVRRAADEGEDLLSCRP
jgi:thymidylate kinase